MQCLKISHMYYPCPQVSLLQSLWPKKMSPREGFCLVDEQQRPELRQGFHYSHAGHSSICLWPSLSRGWQPFLSITCWEKFIPHFTFHQLWGDPPRTASGGAQLWPPWKQSSHICISETNRKASSLRSAHWVYRDTLFHGSEPAAPA
jgi:hypothetical protein